MATFDLWDLSVLSSHWMTQMPLVTPFLQEGVAF